MTELSDIREQRVRKVFGLLFNMVVRPDTKTGADADTTVTQLARGLSEPERNLMLQLLINSYPPHVASQVVRDCMEGAGLPDWSDTHAVSQARFWATGASAGQIDAYAAVCFEMMTPKRQSEFARMVNEKVDGIPQRKAANS